MCSCFSWPAAISASRAGPGRFLAFGEVPEVGLFLEMGDAFRCGCEVEP